MSDTEYTYEQRLEAQRQRVILRGVIDNNNFGLFIDEYQNTNQTRVSFSLGVIDNIHLCSVFSSIPKTVSKVTIRGNILSKYFDADNWLYILSGIQNHNIKIDCEGYDQPKVDKAIQHIKDQMIHNNAELISATSPLILPLASMVANYAGLFAENKSPGLERHEREQKELVREEEQKHQGGGCIIL